MSSTTLLPGPACIFFGNQPSDAQAPFEYTNEETGMKVDRVLDPTSGLCYYPGATKCDYTSYAKALPNPLAAGSAFVFPIFAVYMYFRCKTCKKRFADQGRDWKEEQKKAREEDSAHQQALAQDDDSTPAPAWQAALVLIAALGFGCAIALEIYVGIMMNQQTQKLLAVTDRNSQIIAESVLNPMADIFSFIDDILLVKIGAALAAQDFDMMRKVFVIGTTGGALCGILGALTAVLLMVIPSTANFLLNPFTGNGDGGCSWSTNSDIGTAQNYFLISSLAWPFQFMNFAFSGFAMAMKGKGFLALGIIGLFQQLFSFVMIMFVFTANPHLQILGFSRLGCAASGTILWGIFFACSKDLRKQLGLAQRDEGARALTEGRRGPQQVAAVRDFWSDPETTRAMKDGLMAMVVEVSVEMSRTIALFVAAKSMGIGVFYQISAHVTLQMTTGLAMAEGGLLQMKLQGSQLLGSGLHQHFLWLIEFCLVYALVAVALCCAMVWSGALFNVFESGKAACIFATETACLPDYSGYFGGSSVQAGTVAFPTTIYTVPLIVLIRVLYKFVRAGLYALQDFAFMMKVSLICFGAFLLPLVVVMGVTSKSALVAILVMTVPNFTAMFAFGYRLKGHTDRLDGEDGAQHNPVAVRRQESLRNQYGIDDAVLPADNQSVHRSQETELSWGKSSAADAAVARQGGVMPPPS